MPLFYILCLFGFVFFLGWLFRKQLASCAIVRVSRILIAIFAVVGAVGWCVVLALPGYWAVLMLGMGDGSGAGLQSIFLMIAGFAVVLVLPLLAFAFMFFTSLNRLKGGVRRFAYWYSLVALIVATSGLLMHRSSRLLSVMNLMGIAFMLTAGLWGFAFRESVKQETPTPV
jgi:hypothetical protein